MKKKKNYRLKKILSSIVLVMVVVFFVAFFVITNWRINKRRAELKERITELREEVRIMEEKNAELKERKERTESDEYIEEVAREQLELKKPGEEVVVIQKPASVEDDSGEARKESWWDKIKSIWMRD